MIKLFALAALALQPAAPPQCIPKERIGDIAVVLAPYAIDALARHCTAHLSPTAFLGTGAGALSARLKNEGESRVGAAAETLQRTMGADVPVVANQQALVHVMGEMFAGLMVKDLQPANCDEASSIVESLAPLPAQNLGMLVGSLAGIIEGTTGKASAGTKKAKKGDRQTPGFTICKDG